MSLSPGTRLGHYDGGSALHLAKPMTGISGLS